MSSKAGYIKLFRKIEDSAIWRLPHAQFKVAMKVLLAANWKDGEFFAGGKMVHVPRGSFITSLSNLALQCGVSKGCVRRSLAALKAAQLIGVSPAQSWTRITVVNFESYQGSECVADTVVDPVADTEAVPNRRREEEKKRIPSPKPARVLPSEAIALASQLRASILERQPDYRSLQPKPWEAKTRDAWANTFRLMNSADKRGWADTEAVLAWSQESEFWQTNILSASKFRKQFDALKAQSQAAKTTSVVPITVGDMFGVG